MDLSEFPMRGQRPSAWLLALVAFLAYLGRSPAGELKTFVGFTRPGFPNDVIRGDKIIAVADDPEQRGALGGTVYFMVFERGGDAADPWGTRVKDFVASYRPGIDFNGAAAPELDTKAKYLYLYQVVNDRRTLSPIEAASIRLLVEPSEITSWGFFDGFGFATEAAKEGDKDAPAIKPVAFNNVLTGAAEKRLYQTPAPPSSAGAALRLAPVPTSRKDQGEKGKIINVFWDPLDPAVHPDYVMLLNPTEKNEGAIFRAIWSGKNALGKDARSTVFGFTSNRPPTMEPVKLQTTREASKASGIRPAALDGDPATTADGILAASGSVPTPAPEQPPAAPAGAPPFVPAPVAPLGGTGGGVAGGGFVPPAIGRIGAAGGATAGGGGGAFGTGGGTGTTTTTQDQDTAQPTINFNATLINQQAQAQAQIQGQQQNNGGCCDPGGHVVPEPATLLTAALGLPFLLFLVRRRLS